MKCDICNKEFFTEESFNQHLEDEHKNRVIGFNLNQSPEQLAEAVKSIPAEALPALIEAMKEVAVNAKGVALIAKFELIKHRANSHIKTMPEHSTVQ